MSNTQLSFAEALSQAYESSDSCPPPGAFLADELAALDPESRSNLERHAEQCPACAAERDLASTFENPAPMSARESRDVDHIVRGLKRNAPGRKSGLARLLRFPVVGGLVRSPAFRMAAAAVLVIAVGFAVQTGRTGPPALPDVVVDTVVRGSELTVISPVGEVESIANELVWAAIDGASTYHVTLESVDGSLLWETTGAQTTADLPQSARTQLHRAVTYVWTVEAFDAEGAQIATSGSIEFRARPAAVEN